MRKLKEQHIINVSIELFATNGIRNVSVERIAEKLKVSKGKIYYYFENGKNDIIIEILQMFEELVANSIPSPAEWEAEEADAASILSRLFFTFSEAEALKYRKIIRIILSEMFYNEQIKEYITEKFIRAREELLARCFDSLASKHKIKLLPSDSAARLLNRLIVVYAILDTLEFPSRIDAPIDGLTLMERDCINFVNLILMK